MDLTHIKLYTPLVAAEPFSRKGEKVCGEQLVASGREDFETRAGQRLRHGFVLTLARISIVLCLSQKNPNVSCLWNGKKKSSCLISPLLFKKLGVNFLQNWRERRKSEGHTWAKHILESLPVAGSSPQPGSWVQERGYQETARWS